MLPTAGEIYRRAVARLRVVGIESAQLDARVLLAHVLGVDAAQLIAASDNPVSPEAQDRFEQAITCRAAREPVARIMGVKEFWSREFALSPEALVPRPETETLIEAALLARPERDAQLRVLDLGVGSGVLLGAILLERPAAFGVGVDRSFDAVRTARGNLASLGVADRAQFICGDWGISLGARFDLIVANPPYIARGDMERLPIEVRDHDPVRALDGGMDGLDAYRAILADIGRLVAPGGFVVLELGRGQEQAVADLARDAQIEVNGPAHCDLSGVPRALVLTLST
jgi:release factor glutamine methyltransferase